MGCWRSLRSAFSMELWEFFQSDASGISQKCISALQKDQHKNSLRFWRNLSCMSVMQSELCRQSLPDSPLPCKKSPRAAVLCFNMFHACTLQWASNQNLPDWCCVNPWFVAEGWSKWVRFIQEMLNVIQAVWVVSRKNKYAGKLQRI